jgi:hypothetical protein
MQCGIHVLVVAAALLLLPAGTTARQLTTSPAWALPGKSSACASSEAIANATPYAYLDSDHAAELQPRLLLAEVPPGIPQGIFAAVMRAASPGSTALNSSQVSRYPACAPSCLNSSSSSPISPNRMYEAAVAAGAAPWAAAAAGGMRTSLNDARQLQQYGGTAVLLETEQKDCGSGTDIKYLDRCAA